MTKSKFVLLGRFQIGATRICVYRTSLPEGEFGKWEPDTQSIILDFDAPPTTFVHEVVEAIDSLYELGLDDSGVCIFEQALCQVFPKLIGLPKLDHPVED